MAEFDVLALYCCGESCHSGAIVWWPKVEVQKIGCKAGRDSETSISCGNRGYLKWPWSNFGLLSLYSSNRPVYIKTEARKSAYHLQCEEL